MVKDFVLFRTMIVPSMVPMQHSSRISPEREGVDPLIPPTSK